MRVFMLASLWIAICLTACYEWWHVRRRALAVRYYLESDPQSTPDELRLARFRVTAATFWLVAGALGTVLGLLAILDMAPEIRILLIFAGPVILAAMGWQQDRHERALLFAAAKKAQD